jgi:hypothetical protein
MIDKKYKKCKIKDCKNTAYYNDVEKNKPEYCYIHKTSTMINYCSKYCEKDGCKTIASFNYYGLTKKYCKEHSEEGMENVINKKCEFENCNKRPSFNYEGHDTKIFCHLHKKKNMINISYQLCEEINCNMNAYYKFLDDKKALFCHEHKKDGMYNCYNKLCEMDGCLHYAYFGFFELNKKQYCKQHKLDEMIDLVHDTCIYPNCYERARFNNPEEYKSLFCNKHKSDYMIDVFHKLCKTPLCYTRICDKYDGYCFYCYVNIFPEHEISRNFKTKEKHIVEYIKEQFNDKTWISDKIIKDGCSRRRPDLLLDLGYLILIIEIDENQHINYDCSCEMKRIEEIHKDLGYRPLLFIRFNPDSYIDENNQLISSCWTINKKGICQIDNNKKNEWNNRLNILKNEIQQCIDTNFEDIHKLYDFKYLFFDSIHEI